MAQTEHLPMRLAETVPGYGRCAEPGAEPYLRFKPAARERGTTLDFTSRSALQ